MFVMGSFDAQVPPDPSLFVVFAQVQLGVIVNQSEPHMIEPAAPTKYVAAEGSFPGEVNYHVKAVTERGESQSVSESVEAARRRADLRQCSAFNINPQCLPVAAIENAETRARVHASIEVNEILADA